MSVKRGDVDTRDTEMSQEESMNSVLTCFLTAMYSKLPNMLK